MSIGASVRKILGRRLSKIAAHCYRTIFVNLDEMARTIAPFVPPNADVLDVGGGDGEPLNYLMALRPDIHVTMIDLSENIGLAIDEQFISRIRLFPMTSIREWIETKHEAFQVVLISDVIHHVRASRREDFIRDLRDLVGSSPVRVIVKEVEPGYFRSKLSLLADRYVSGDKTVSLVSRVHLQDIFKKVFGECEAQETPMFSNDKPNYCLVFSLNQ